MNREALQRAVALGGSFLLCAAMVYRYSARRPPYFALPSTLVDHAGPAEHETRGALILVKQVEPLIPRGAEVAVFRPKDGRAWDDNGVYLTAVGLLPHHSVLPPWTASADLRGDQLVEYVVAVDHPFDHPSYAPIAGFPRGWLYKRR